MGFCEKHGEYESEQLVILGRTFRTSCPLCDAEEKAEQARKVQEAELAKRAEELQKRGIEPEYFNATLENYKAENDSEQAALNACIDMDCGAINKIVLLGSNGVGKTHLASALALKHKGIVITMFKLSDLIRRGYRENKTDCDVLDSILRYPFIAIDEIGRTKGSDAERNWFSYLVDKAHARNIKLMLISNRQTAKHLPQERKGEAFEYFVDNDVISRLQAKCKVVEINGRDRRRSTAI